MMAMLSNLELLKLADKVSKMKNPKFKFGEFTIDGETWTGILIREDAKEAKEK